MKKLLLIFLSSMFICFSMSATALAQDLDDLADVERVICLPSIQVGNSLTVDVEVRNRTGSPITLTRAMVGLAGTGSTFERAVTWGPYQRTISWSLNGGQTKTFTLTIVNSVPSNLARRMAIATVVLIPADGALEDTLGGACMVHVNP